MLYLTSNLSVGMLVNRLSYDVMIIDLETARQMLVGEPFQSAIRDPLIVEALKKQLVLGVTQSYEIVKPREGDCIIVAHPCTRKNAMHFTYWKIEVYSIGELQ